MATTIQTGRARNTTTPQAVTDEGVEAVQAESTRDQPQDNAEQHQEGTTLTRLQSSNLPSRDAQGDGTHSGSIHSDSAQNGNTRWTPKSKQPPEVLPSALEKLDSNLRRLADDHPRDLRLLTYCLSISGGHGQAQLNQYVQNQVAAEKLGPVFKNGLNALIGRPRAEYTSNGKLVEKVFALARRLDGGRAPMHTGHILRALISTVQREAETPELRFLKILFRDANAQGIKKEIERPPENLSQHTQTQFPHGLPRERHGA